VIPAKACFSQISSATLRRGLVPTASYFLPSTWIEEVEGLRMAHSTVVINEHRKRADAISVPKPLATKADGASALATTMDGASALTTTVENAGALVTSAAVNASALATCAANNQPHTGLAKHNPERVCQYYWPMSRGCGVVGNQVRK
jgi:hypothetical protein